MTMPAKSSLIRFNRLRTIMIADHAVATTARSMISAAARGTGLASRKVNATPSGVRTRQSCVRSVFMLFGRPLPGPIFGTSPEAEQIPDERHQFHDPEGNLQRIRQHRLVVLRKK